LREASYEYPLLDLSLFRIRNFTVGCLATSILFFAMSASIFLIPYFLQGIKALSAEQAGYWMLAMPIMNTIVSPIAGRLSDKMNPKYLMCLGPLLFSFGMSNLMNLKVEVSYWEFFALLIPLGIGNGLLISPSFNVMMASIPIQKAGVANGTLRSVNTLAQAMGVAVGGVLLTNRMKDWIPGYGNQIPDPGTMSILSLLAVYGNSYPLVSMVEGFMDSFRFVFSITLWLPVLASLIILFFVSGEEHMRSVVKI